MIFDLDEADRQAVVLALAILALQRPGWYEYLRGIAGQFDGPAEFLTFHAANEDLFDPRCRPPCGERNDR